MSALSIKENQLQLQLSDEKKLKALHVVMAVFVVMALLLLGMPDAVAFSAPAAGTPGYEVYDLIVNDIIKGPIGQAGGVFFMAKGASELNQSPWKAGATVVGGGMLFQAEALSTSFGFSIDALSYIPF